MLRVPFYLLVVLGILAAASGLARAQPNALDREHKASVLFEAAHPLLGPVSDQAWTTGAATIAARYRFVRWAAVVLDAAFSHYEWTEPGFRVYSDSFALEPFPVSGSAIGNAYFGLELLIEGTPSLVEFGVRPNFWPGYSAALVGASTDLSRWEPFMNAPSVRMGFRTHTDLSRPGFVNFRGAMVAFTGGNSADLQLYGGATGTRRFGGKWFVAPAVDARVFLGDNVNDRFLSQFEMAGGYADAHFRPEMFARLYMDRDWQDLVNWSLGLRVGWF